MKQFIINSPTGKNHTVFAETKYHAIHKVVEHDGFKYSNCNYKNMKYGKNKHK